MNGVHIFKVECEMTVSEKECLLNNIMGGLNK